MNDKDKNINKYLTNSISENEIEQLHTWVYASVENEKYFCEYKNIWVAMQMNNTNENIDIKSEFDLLQESIKDDNKELAKPDILKKVYVMWQKIAAILILPIFLALFMHYHTDSETKIDNKEAKIVYNQLYTPKGVRAKLKLNDGTIVWLNSDTKIKYSTNSELNTRNVELNGEAYFEVAHNKNRPFIVSANGLNVKVLGTSFNVNTYSKKHIETTLVEGSVELYNKNKGKSILLKPGYKAIYNYKSGATSVKKTNVKYATAWKEGSILLSDTPMNHVITSIERWYGVDITVADKEILQYSFTANFKNKSLSEILNLLKISSPIAYKINGKNVIIYSKKKRK